MANPGKNVCPYCRKPMTRWANPEMGCWSGEYQYVCFNDECSYFVCGWDWMETHFHVRVSYRHRFDPVSGDSGPLPVWSKGALRDHIINEKDVTHA
ncbi:MAG TPA: ogr/Delta-like zinc finger family protein [Terriglobia bacterium]|nr:ogr/Delta-like zinc finger family protein [Terriglobia bacterium]